MDKLIIEGTETTPVIIMDPGNESYEISGRSFPEDPNEFYQPLFDWIDTNIPQIGHKMVFNMKMEYFNSSSNRMVLLILKRLEEHFQHGKEIEVNWYYDDEEVLGDGQMYSALVKLPFELIDIEE